MKKSTKVWLIVAGSLLAAGLVICTIVLFSVHFDFSYFQVQWPFF